MVTRSTELRLGGRLEPVPGSHFKSHVNLRLTTPSDVVGSDHKADSHRVGGEGSRIQALASERSVKTAS